MNLETLTPDERQLYLSAFAVAYVEGFRRVQDRGGATFDEAAEACSSGETPATIAENALLAFRYSMGQEEKDV